MRITAAHGIRAYAVPQSLDLSPAMPESLTNRGRRSSEQEEKMATTQRSVEEIHLGTSRIRFKTILIPTDFSLQSQAAAELATSLAHRFDSELLFLHVVAPITYSPGVEVASDSLMESAAEDARRQMDECVASCPDWQELRHQQLVEYGPLIDAVNRTVAKHKVDLIVCGSHGVSGLERIVLGSMAEMILRHASCPVLVVGPKCHQRQFEGSTIVLSTSLGPESYRPAQYAVALAEEMNARLTLVHLAKEVPENLSEPVVRHRLCSDARALLPEDAENWCRIKTQIIFDDDVDSIVSLAAREHARLIVMGVHERGPLARTLAGHFSDGAVAKVIRGAHCPVLAVRGHFGS